MNLWGPPVRAFLPGWHRAVKGRTWPAWHPHSQIDHILVRGEVRVGCGVGPPRRRLRSSPGAGRADPAIIAPCSTPTSTCSPGSLSPARSPSPSGSSDNSGGRRPATGPSSSSGAPPPRSPRWQGRHLAQAVAGILTGIGFIGAGLVFVARRHHPRAHLGRQRLRRGGHRDRSSATGICTWVSSSPWHSCSYSSSSTSPGCDSSTPAPTPTGSPTTMRRGRRCVGATPQVLRPTAGPASRRPHRAHRAHRARPDRAGAHPEPGPPTLSRARRRVLRRSAVP